MLPHVDELGAINVLLSLRKAERRCATLAFENQIDACQHLCEANRVNLEHGLFSVYGLEVVHLLGREHACKSIFKERTLKASDLIKSLNLAWEFTKIALVETVLLDKEERAVNRHSINTKIQNGFIAVSVQSLKCNSLLNLQELENLTKNNALAKLAHF